MMDHKNPRIKSHVFTACLLFFACGTFAQSKSGTLLDSRTQAEGWYVPVKGKVVDNGAKVDNANVRVFKDNAELGSTQTRKGKFALELDLDGQFTIIISKQGFQDKYIYVDTHLPKDLVKYPAYECFVNLDPSSAAVSGDPFYNDFPSAIVRYNAEQGGFYHSEHYLTHIQTKRDQIAKTDD